jgi:hypothetical protein
MWITPFNPSQATSKLGNAKKGDLAALRVHKFRSQGQLYLLGYTVDDTIRLIYLEAVGSHENFYRDLKRRFFEEMLCCRTRPCACDRVNFGPQGSLCVSNTVLAQ